MALPPFPFEDPCPSSWPPEAAGLLLEETRAAPNRVTELPLANFGKNPEQPQQGPILSATPQLDAGMSSLPPFTDKVDQLADSFKMGTEFDPPVPATNPVPTATAILVRLLTLQFWDTILQLIMNQPFSNQSFPLS